MHRGALVEGEPELALDIVGQAVAFGMAELHVERLQPPEHGEPDASRADRPYGHALQIVRAGEAVGDVPAAFYDPPVREDVVADERRGSSSLRAPRR